MYLEDFFSNGVDVSEGQANFEELPERSHLVSKACVNNFAREADERTDHRYSRGRKKKEGKKCCEIMKKDFL